MDELRTRFDSSTGAEPISVSGPDDFFRVRRCAEHFNRFGFGWLRLPRGTSPQRALLPWQAIFGAIWHHDRSDPTGMALVAERPKDRFGSEYLGVSSAAHPPHTDGAYALEPPRIVMLFCESPAEQGGETVLVSGAALFASLACTPHDLHALRSPRALRIARGPHESSTAVFSGRARTKIVFRGDTAASVLPSQAASAAYARLRRGASATTAQLSFSMKAGDLLIVDNTAVLHGRTAFETRRPGEPGRKLWRLAFSRSHPALLEGFRGQRPTPRQPLTPSSSPQVSAAAGGM